VLASAAVATGHHLAPFFDRVGDTRFDLLDREQPWIVATRSFIFWVLRCINRVNIARPK
jgi:hypothetical protein